MLKDWYVIIKKECSSYKKKFISGQNQSEARVTTQLDHQSRHIDDDGRQVMHEQQDGM